MKKILIKTLIIVLLFSSLISMFPKNSYANIWELPKPKIIGEERCTPSGAWWYPDLDDNTGIDTAIGCIPLEIGFFGSKEGSVFFTAFILQWAIGLGAGVAFLLIIYASFLIITSAGNPQQVQSGKELLTSAIMGLIMLLGSVYILKIIGVDILGLQEIGL